MTGRRTELAAAGVSAALALALALALPSAPLLADNAGDGWARVLEFVAMTALLFALLSILGIIKSSVVIGPNGLTARRGHGEAAHGEAKQAVDAELVQGLDVVEKANRDLAEKVARLEGIVEVLVASGASAPRTIDHRRRDAHGASSGDLPRPNDHMEP